jgi:acyl-CoA dehydrogenase
MDSLISQVPFFTPEHRSLAQSVAEFVAREIEPRAAIEDDIDGLARDFVKLLAEAGILNHAIATTKLDVRALCLIREELAYSSALADLTFVCKVWEHSQLRAPRPITCVISGSRARLTEKRSLRSR